jgi:glucose-1-phosphate cytidylyltransferase
MKVVILAGGKGTRLSEYTKILPKPMIKIGSKPILEHIINYYMKFGFKDFIIASGYKHNIIKNYFKNKKNMKIILKRNLINETKLLQLNSGKAKTILLWKTKWSIKKTIQSTCEWYLGFMKKENLKLLTKRQIYEYFK